MTSSKEAEKTYLGLTGSSAWEQAKPFSHAGADTLGSARNSSTFSSGSALERLGRCPSCLGSGARPTTAVSVVLPTVSIYVDVLPISRSATQRWKRRLALVLGALVTAAAGQSTWTFVTALW